jgi:hypothetical protein
MQYRVSMNGAATNNLQATVPTNSGAATYTGRRLLGSKKRAEHAGYFEYGFRVREQLLPYKVGSYLGKKVFNIGAGFFSQQMVPQLLMLLEI